MEPHAFTRGTPSLLVGREREQTALRNHLGAARAGHGSLVLIGGEAGIGKTSLAETLCREAAEQDALVLIGRCYDLTETPPYGPWIELFKQYRQTDRLPSLPLGFARFGMVGDSTSQAGLFQQVEDFLTELSAHHPLVVLLDDLHWVDPASLDLLRLIARSLSSLPILTLGNYRADELTRHHPLYAALPVLAHEAHTTRLDLQPLDVDAVCELIATRYRLVPPDDARLLTYLQERAQGNPFFLGEILRTLEEDQVLRATESQWTLGDLTHVRVPELLQQVVDGRLTRLGEEAYTLLAAAAVIGQDVPVTVWTTVCGATEETIVRVIELAAGAHLMDETPDGARARFVHALIREALYEGILPSRRRQIHRRVGEALMVTSPIDPDAVAYHFREAGDARTAEWLVKAGERAERAYAWLTSSERYAAAAALMEGRETDAVARGWLLLRLAWLRRWGDPQGGIIVLKEAARLAAETGDRALAGCVTFFRGSLQCRLQEYRGGLAAIREAAEALDALSEEDSLRVRAHDLVAADFTADRRWGNLAMWLAHAGHYGEAQAIAERVLTALGPTADNGDHALRTGEPNAYFALGLVHAGRGEPEMALAAFTRTSMLHAEAGNLAGAAQAATQALEWVILPYHADQAVVRLRRTIEVEEMWRQTSGVFQAGDATHFPRLLLLSIEGNWDEARRMAVALHAAHGLTRARYLATRTLAALARDQGDTTLAWALIEEMLPEGQQSISGEKDFFPALALQRVAANLALDAGDLNLARAWLETHDRWLAWNRSMLGRGEGLLAWAAYWRAARDGTLAYQQASKALAHAMQYRQPLTLLAAHRLLGELETDAGHYADARVHLNAALSLADACAAPYECALTLLAQAELGEAEGDNGGAAILLDEARAICEPLHAAPALARADILAARLTALDHTHPAYADSLTEREAEVLRLIVRGLNNQQIATTLFISIRTVNRHIENLYRKTGAHSKAEATAYAFRNQRT